MRSRADHAARHRSRADVPAGTEVRADRRPRALSRGAGARRIGRRARRGPHRDADGCGDVRARQAGPLPPAGMRIGWFDPGQAAMRWAEVPELAFESRRIPQRWWRATRCTCRCRRSKHVRASCGSDGGKPSCSRSQRCSWAPWHGDSCRWRSGACATRGCVAPEVNRRRSVACAARFGRARRRRYARR